MYLLDTNTCIYAMKNSNPHLSRKLFETNPLDICISSVTVGELEYGCLFSSRGDRSRAVMNLFLSTYSILPFAESDGRLFGQLMPLLRKRGLSIGLFDTQIAAQAIARNLTLVTENIETLSSIPGLKFEDWIV